MTTLGGKKDFSSKVHSSLHSWLMWAGAASFFFYQFILRVSPGVVAADLMQELSISACALGGLASFYYYGYTGMQILVGFILDRLGVRRPLTAAVLCCVAGSFIFSSATSVEILSLGRLLIGVGSAFGFLSCVKTSTQWFPPHRLSLVLGLSMTLGTLGGTSGGLPLAMLVDAWDWRGAIFLMGCIGVIIALIIFFFIKDTAPGLEKKALDQSVSDPEIEESISKNERELPGLGKALGIILTNPLTWVFGGYGSLMYIILSGFADLWGVPYVLDTYGVSRPIAAGLSSMIYVGIAIAGPTWALIIDRVESYKKIMRSGALGAFLLFSFMVYGPEIPFSALYPLYILLGFFCGAQFFSFASVCLINPSSMSGTASGVHNMMCMMSGVIFQPLIGYLLDWNSTTHQEAGCTPSYLSEDYAFALLILPIAMLAAFALTFLMKETYPKNNSSKV